VLAATIEHLVHSEAIKRLGNAFKVHKFLPTSLMSEHEADEVLDTYMTSYILGEDLSNMTLEEALEVKAEMPEIYGAWNATKEFVRTTRQSVSKSDASAEQKSSGGLDFGLVAHVAERVGERFGTFQDQECQQIKTALVKKEEAGTGRVRLSDFYRPAVDGEWQFQESVAYLRQLGALDESDADKPRVIIANYITAPANCIASSSFYAVCSWMSAKAFLAISRSRLLHQRRQLLALPHLFPSSHRRQWLRQGNCRRPCLTVLARLLHIMVAPCNCMGGSSPNGCITRSRASALTHTFQARPTLLHPMSGSSLQGKRPSLLTRR